MDDYGRELAAVADHLRGHAVSCSIRGDGSGRFVFAERGSSATELSRIEDGWWVEFWDGDRVAFERTFTSTEEAVRAARGWLATHPSL